MTIIENTTKKSETISWLAEAWASIAATALLLILCCGIYPVVVWGIGQGLFPHKANGSLIGKDGSPAHDSTQAMGSALIGQQFTASGYFHPRPSAANNSPGSSFSSTGGYDPTGSNASNFGPLSDELLNGATNPAAGSTGETLAYDGIRLRAIHYAVENHIRFKLETMRADGAGLRSQVPIGKFEDAQGNLNDIALVDSFPHPPNDGDHPERMVIVAADFATPIPADAVTASASGLDPHVSVANAELQKQRVAAARNIPAEKVESLIQSNTEGPDLGILGDPGVNVLKLNLALDTNYPAPAAQPANP